MAKRNTEEINQDLHILAQRNRERMENESRLTMYVWETAGDERVHPSHKKMDGKLCLWADPAVYSRDKGKTWIPRPKGATLTYPGDEEGCRCTAIAFEPELLGEL